MAFSQDSEVYRIKYEVTINDSKRDFSFKNEFSLTVDTYSYKYEFSKKIDTKTPNFYNNKTNIGSYSYHIGRIGQNKDYWLNNMLGKEVNVVDSLPTINWEITKEKKKIAGFLSTKAIGNYRGRIMIVYFVESIPIAIGPNNLNGLPGIVISATSYDGEYEFKATKVNKIIRPSDFVYYDNYDFGEVISLKDYITDIDDFFGRKSRELESKIKSRLSSKEFSSIGEKGAKTSHSMQTLEMFYEWELENEKN